MADLDFARRAHHASYRDVATRQWGRWDEKLQDRLFDRDWGDAHFDILLVDGVPCGYTSVEDRREAIHLVELVLCPRFQSRGIGSAFLRSVIARAGNVGKPLRLRTCIENHRAQSFYGRHGFRETGRDETHLLMERPRGSLNSDGRRSGGASAS